MGLSPSVWSIPYKRVTNRQSQKDVGGKMKVFVGYDTREDIAYQVCKHSIISKQPNADVQPLKQQELRDAGWYTRPVDKLASTEFTFTRFLIPELTNFEGWALFMDCDMILTTDIKELFDQADDKYAVMCVHHDYKVQEGVKMDGQKQTVYPRKNWSSVVLWNCGHPSNKVVTTDLINNLETTGKYMHRFSWLKDEEIGKLDHTWNYLVGVYDDYETPKLIHYTEGGPWFENYRECEFSDLWKKELFEMMK
jgi:lipopolysaccharide biosynthesis glycosyltransferase